MVSSLAVTGFSIVAVGIDAVVAAASPVEMTASMFGVDLTAGGGAGNGALCLVAVCSRIACMINCMSSDWTMSVQLQPVLLQVSSGIVAVSGKCLE